MAHVEERDGRKRKRERESKGGLVLVYTLMGKNEIFFLGGDYCEHHFTFAFQFSATSPTR